MFEVGKILRSFTMPANTQNKTKQKLEDRRSYVQFVQGHYVQVSNGTAIGEKTIFQVTMREMHRKSNTISCVSTAWWVLYEQERHLVTTACAGSR